MKLRGPLYIIVCFLSVYYFLFLNKTKLQIPLCVIVQFVLHGN